MFERYLSKNLKEGEEVVRFVRRYIGSMIGSVILAAVLILAPFFFLFPLLRLGLPGVLGVLVLFILGVIVLVRMVVLYSLNVLIITNQRLIDVDQRGFFHRVVSESSYDKIQDVSFSMKGLSQTLLRYGNVLIQTAGAQTNLEIQHVHNPQKIQELISDLQAEMGDGEESEEDTLSAEELVHLAERLKKGLGHKEFEQLIRKKKERS